MSNSNRRARSKSDNGHGESMNDVATSIASSIDRLANVIESVKTVNKGGSVRTAGYYGKLHAGNPEGKGKTGYSSGGHRATLFNSGGSGNLGAFKDESNYSGARQIGAPAGVRGLLAAPQSMGRSSRTLVTMPPAFGDATGGSKRAMLADWGRKRPTPVQQASGAGGGQPPIGGGQLQRQQQQRSLQKPDPLQDKKDTTKTDGKIVASIDSQMKLQKTIAIAAGATSGLNVVTRAVSSYAQINGAARGTMFGFEKGVAGQEAAVTAGATALGGVVGGIFGNAMGVAAGMAVGAAGGSLINATADYVRGDKNTNMAADGRSAIGAMNSIDAQVRQVTGERIDLGSSSGKQTIKDVVNYAKEESKFQQDIMAAVEGNLISQDKAKGGDDKLANSNAELTKALNKLSEKLDKNDGKRVDR